MKEEDISEPKKNIGGLPPSPVVSDPSDDEDILSMK